MQDKEKVRAATELGSVPRTEYFLFYLKDVVGLLDAVSIWCLSVSDMMSYVQDYIGYRCDGTDSPVWRRPTGTVGSPRSDRRPWLPLVVLVGEKVSVNTGSSANGYRHLEDGNPSIQMNGVAQSALDTTLLNKVNLFSCYPIFRLRFCLGTAWSPEPWDGEQCVGGKDG